jgi:Protein of unknown function (DUF3014)
MTRPLALGLAVAVAIIAGLAYYYFQQEKEAVPVPPVAQPAPAPAPENTAAAPPPIQFPIPEAPVAQPPLPDLFGSDSVIQDALAGLYGRESLARFFNLDDMVRRFVATVDNLPRKTTAARLMPVKPVPGPFEVTANGDTFGIAPDNALRYRPYIVAMEAVEAKKLVASYVHYYPLFQVAYQELGYPNRYFNDRLVEAIDDMLAAPDVAAPQLTQPKVLYQFADPELEGRSAGQKIMIRMGPGNAARVKDKLRAIRKELTGQAPRT